jgi:hypothetical protein
MGSISSPSSVLSSLFQTLSAQSPQLSSILSTPNVKAALEKAPVGDLVTLSDQALQLQETSLLFGAPAQNWETGSNSVFQALESAVNPAPSSGTDPIASIASNQQVQELDAFFGAPATVNPPLLNTLA